MQRSRPEICFIGFDSRRFHTRMGKIYRINVVLSNYPTPVVCQFGEMVSRGACNSVLWVRFLQLAYAVWQKSAGESKFFPGLYLTPRIFFLVTKKGSHAPTNQDGKASLRKGRSGFGFRPTRLPGMTRPFFKEVFLCTRQEIISGRQ